MYYSNEKIKRGESQKSRVPTLETFEAQAFDPGVAKFGIALEWGSRGPEFESQHSDQNKRTSALQMSFYFEFRRPKGGSPLWRSDGRRWCCSGQFAAAHILSPAGGQPQGSEMPLGALSVLKTAGNKKTEVSNETSVSD